MARKEIRLAPDRLDGDGLAIAGLVLGYLSIAMAVLAVLALSGGEYKLSGVPRMHQRPIRDLVEPLRSIASMAPAVSIGQSSNAMFVAFHISSTAAATRFRRCSAR